MRIGVKVARCSLEAEIGVRIPDPQQTWTGGPRSGKSRGGGVRREEKIALISIEVGWE